jgi:hypothetical protein
MFPRKTIMPMGQSVKWLINCEMPLTPPEAKFAGTKKTRKLNAWMRELIRINP